LQEAYICGFYAIARTQFHFSLTVSGDWKKLEVAVVERTLKVMKDYGLLRN